MHTVLWNSGELRTVGTWAGLEGQPRGQQETGSGLAYTSLCVTTPLGDE